MAWRLGWRADDDDVGPGRQVLVAHDLAAGLRARRIADSSVREATATTRLSRWADGEPVDGADPSGSGEGVVGHRRRTYAEPAPRTPRPGSVIVGLW